MSVFSPLDFGAFLPILLFTKIGLIIGLREDIARLIHVQLNFFAYFEQDLVLEFNASTSSVYQDYSRATKTFDFGSNPDKDCFFSSFT